MIVSTVHGRIRVRSKRLKSSRVCGSLKIRIAALPGVTDVRINPVARSIIIHFDASCVDCESLEDQVLYICQPSVKKTAFRGKRMINKVAKVGMMTTLTTSLAYAYAGKKKQHISYGKAFVVFAGIHMLGHAKALLR